MKNLNLRYVAILVLLSSLIIPGLSFNLTAQNTEKTKIRIKADYTKVMGQFSYIDISTTARINKKNTGIANLDLTIVSEKDDNELELGQVLTNLDGKSRFIIKDLSKLLKDSLGVYNLSIKFKGNDSYNKTSKGVSFKDASIDANTFTKDSVNYLIATLKDVFLDSLLTETSLKVNVERLFKSLPIGKEFKYTDKNGAILVPIEKGIPGIDGNIVLEVILVDSDDYGTVKALIDAPFGEPVILDNTFYKRTLWSSRDKTPIFILVFANLLIVTIWGIFIYLFINLIKIKKS